MSELRGNDAFIRRLVDEVVANCCADESLIKIEEKDQIANDVVIDIITNLRNLIFPGYFSRKPLKRDSLDYYIGELLEELLYHLGKQIERALRHRKDGDSNKLTDAGEIARTFLCKLPVIRAIMSTDVDAAFDGDPAAFNKDEIILSYPGIYAVMVNRLAHELYLLDVPLIPRMMSEYAHRLTGIDIHPGASIGRYFFIDHGTGIVIGETTVIGNYVKIYQGVTLGAISTRGGQGLGGVKRHPTIEDHVTIYSGASILGGSTVIGEGAVIGSNAFITKSVPDATRVSVKSPELQFKTSDKTQSGDFSQEDLWYWSI
ncbi:serine acetyltransferase [Clostridia bacterium]|nr:serine acetyltransferase [Clostridia bacterium]